MNIDIGSVVRGIRAMRLKNGAKWAIKWMPKRIWCDAWTPIWHEGRGPYLTLGLWFVAIYRGY